MESNIIKYRQIDFLRLFRLCKNLGFIKYKRKMPIECDYDKSKITLKRLLRVLLKGLFVNIGVIKHHRDKYFLMTQDNFKTAYRFIERLELNYIEELGAEGLEILNSCEQLKNLSNGFVNFHIPYEIVISPVSRDTNSVYNIAQQSGATSRPSEEFYHCALACIEYKSIWDNNSKKIIEFYEKELNLIEERKKQMVKEQEERREAKRKELLQKGVEEVNIRNKRLQELEKKVKEQRSQRLSQSQIRFNEILARRRYDDAG